MPIKKYSYLFSITEFKKNFSYFIHETIYNKKKLLRIEQP